MKVTNGATKIVGIIGDPIEHTFSPAMHNAAFKHLKLPYTYEKFHVKPRELARAVRNFQKNGATGLNVTVPHKEKALKLCDFLSHEAIEAGAVNVLIFKGGKIYGDNTDVYGFSKSLKEAKISLRGKKVSVLGAGGAARACAAACVREGAKEILFFNRTVKKAQELVHFLQKNFFYHATLAFSLKDTHEMLFSDVLIQTTSVGMFPNVKDCVLKADNFPPVQTAIDIVYRPENTKFLQIAKKKGVKKILGGLPMLLHQGAKAFELWTGKKAPLEVMRRALLAQMK